MPGSLRPPLRLRRIGAALASLLIAAAAVPAARSAEVLELRLEGLAIPIRLDQLDRWSRRFDAGRRPPAAVTSAGRELVVWLDLLRPSTRASLAELLQAPLLRDRSFGRQLLDSWAGGPMLAEVGGLLTTPEGSSSTALLQTTLRRLLEERRTVTAIELLRAMPVPRLSLQLDRLLSLAEQWRGQLERQRTALRQLRRLPLPADPAAAVGQNGLAEVIDANGGNGGNGAVPPLATASTAQPDPSGPAVAAAPRQLPLAVNHRLQPLPLDLWLPPPSVRSGAATRPWVLMMPGLGGDASHLGWLAGALAGRGWPVVVLQHPGSDAAAVRSSLEGRRPPPGAETLAVRLADVEAVLAAQRRGALPLRGDGVVLVGHSLGGVTALLAAGLEPEPGLGRRCLRLQQRLPLSNPSRLLQCQLPDGGLPPVRAAAPDLRGVVLLNGFGSLLWPRRGLAPLPRPVLMVGGSLDLVTPPLEEQLGLFLPPGDARSRLALVEGGSHFSPVRMSESEEALFRLGDELVGVEPRLVQDLLLRLTLGFLEGLAPARPLPSQRLHHGPVSAYVMDAEAARRWHGSLRR